MTLTPKRLTVLLLLALQFTASVTMSMIYSLAPTITAYFHIPVSNATFLNIGFMGAGLLAPIFGYFADRQGTKPVLVVGAILFTLGHLTAAFSTSVWLYFLARALIGLGYSCILGLTVSYLSQLLDHSRMGQISAYLKLAFGLGIFIAPILASSIVAASSFRTLYLILTLVSAVLAIGLLRIPHVRFAFSDHVTLNEIKALFRNRTVLLYLGVSLATNLPGTIFFNFLSVYLSQVGFSQNAISTIYTLTGVGTIASAFVIFFLNKRFGMIRIFRWGLWVTIGGLIPMLTLNPLLIIPFSVLFSLGYDTIVGLINPVLALEYPRHSGSVIMMISLLGAVYGIMINLLGPIQYARFGFLMMLALALTGCVLGTLSLQRALKRV